MIKLKPFLLILVLLPFLQGCNDKDDIDAIFSGTWKLNNFYKTTDWKDDRKSSPVYDTRTEEGRKALEQMNQEGKFTINFSEGNFTGIADEKAFSGTWQADGKKNTVSIAITSGGTTSDAIGKKFFEALANARYYTGDIYYLQLYSEERDSYIQFKREK